MFENKYTRDKEWAKDIYGYICIKRPIMFVFYVLFAIYLIKGILDLIIIHRAELFCFIVPLAWCVVIAFSYKRNVKLALRRDMELHSKPIDVTVTVTDDMMIHSQSTGAEYNLRYSDIKKAVQTKKYIYVWSKANMLYSLKKDAFTYGSADDFVKFLRSKGIKIK